MTVSDSSNICDSSNSDSSDSSSIDSSNSDIFWSKQLDTLTTVSRQEIMSNILELVY